MKTSTALILAAGANSRFFPFNNFSHKSTFSVLGQSLILRTLESLRSVGIQKAVVVLSENDMLDQNLHHFLQEHVQDLELTFVMQPEPKGMGNAVLSAREHLEEQFVVVFPYSFDCVEPLQEMLALDEPEVICISETKEPWLYGIATLEDDRAVAITEKPEAGTEPSHWKVEGVYLLSQQFLHELEKTPEGQYSFEEALNTLMHQRSLATIQVDTSLLSLKYPWHLFRFTEYLFTHAKTKFADSAEIADTAIIDDTHGAVIIESGAKIGDNVKIVGPCYIGEGAMIGDYSFVRHSDIEKNAVVGANTEVVRSILAEGASLHFGYVADSILGKNVRVGAGLIVANKRHDRHTVHVEVKGEKIDSKLPSLGVMIGDEAKIGISTNILPGKCIGARAFLYPNMTIYQNIPHEAIVKKKETIEIL